MSVRNSITNNLGVAIGILGGFAGIQVNIWKCNYEIMESDNNLGYHLYVNELMKILKNIKSLW